MNFNSENSSCQFVRVDQFTPNSRVTWTSFGAVAACVQDPGANSFTLTGVSPGPGLAAPVLKIYLLGPAAFRVRFNPAGNYANDGSFAVVNSNLGAVALTILQNDAQKLSVNLGGLRLDVLKQPFTVQVFLNNQLISTDTDQGLVYLPGNLPGRQAVANFKNYPANANYFGFGEKGGGSLQLNECTLTMFNYDNYKYSGANGGAFSVVPPDTGPGPLNPDEPLYNSIPLLIEDNPNPLNAQGRPTGAPYCYGLFLDNESQTFFNLGASSASSGNMYGKYYFGALYGEIDYYFLAGNTVADVLKQYATLTGPPALAPMYTLGYHQGCYGYYDHNRVLGAAQAHWNNQIPLDGIHIDVDFQNNYRTFTASPAKFPNDPATGQTAVFAQLAALGVKASTNITGIVSIGPDENGNGAYDPSNPANPSSYSTLNSGLALVAAGTYAPETNAFYEDVRSDFNPPASPGNFVVNEDYGGNFGSNPYIQGGPFNPFPLGTYGYYADLGRLDVRAWWGQQYQTLLDAGLEMVWQDMTDPATVQSVSDPMPWKTLALDLKVYDFTSNAMVPHAVIHNVFSLNLISATYEGIVALRQASGVDKRPFIIARGGYAGVQRYAATWTGDSASDWGFLSILIPEILNFGLSGQPMVGADVGGFAISRYGVGYGTGSGSYGDAGVGYFNGGNPYIQNGAVLGGITDADLLTRWTTMSAFFGWFRNHYDGYNKQYQEVYAYGEPVLSNCRNYIQIRYKLLQYFYDALYQSNQTGLPICRALFVNDRADPNVYQHLDDQFMVGPNILVAPVVIQNSTSREVYLPATSSWYAYTDNTAPLQGPSPGGQLISWYVPVSLVPVYIRAGGIIPHREVEQYVGQRPVNPLTFDVYPGPASTYTLYLDDRVSMQYQTKGAYRLTQISQSQTIGAQRVQTVSVVRTYDQYTPNEPYYFVALLATPPPLSVTAGGQALPQLTAASDNAAASLLAASAVNACYYNQSLQTTFAKIFDVSGSLTLVGTFPVT
jgi:alpha-glucosidase